MDETEHARRCIDLSDDARVAYTALAGPALEKNQVALLQFCALLDAPS